jgi:hypothetical protein
MEIPLMMQGHRKKRNLMKRKPLVLQVHPLIILKKKKWLPVL